VITALPLRSPASAAQFASFSAAIVYVVVEPGITFTAIVGAVPLNGIPPGLSVPLIVPAPVTAMLRVVLSVEQMLFDPLSTPVGRVFRFTVAEPVRPPASAVQLASLREANVYTVLANGDTFTVIVGAVPLNGMAPGLNVPEIVPDPVTGIVRA
jgi:hypothetical protein